jgi:hypothetical protein
LAKISLKLAVPIAMLLGLVFSQPLFAAVPPGITTAPYQITYTAKLTDAANAPVTATQTVRFSLWTDADWDASDVDVLGDINPLAVGYAGWQETHTVTPNSEGIFTKFHPGHPSVPGSGCEARAISQYRL